MHRRLAPLVCCLLLAACGGRLSVADVAESPAGTTAITYSKSYPPGTWTAGDHAYRIVLTCPDQDVPAPVVSFTVDEAAPSVGTVYLRGDGPHTSLMAAGPPVTVNPSDVSVVAVTLAGMSPEQAAAARTDCNGSVIRDGMDAEPLTPGDDFSP